jgi:HEAT repeat protein
LLRLLTVAVIAAAVLMLHFPAYADTIILKNGCRLHGKVVRESEDEVVINVGGAGTVTVRRSRIEKIRRDRIGLPPGGLDEPETDEPDKPQPDPSPPGPEVDPPAPATRPDDKPEIPTPKTKPEAPNGPGAAVIEEFKRSMPNRYSLPVDILRAYTKKLTALGKEATPDLSYALMYSKDWRVRYLAAEAFTKIKDPASIPALIHALGDEFLSDFTLYDRGGRLHKDYRIRKIAAEAIDAIGSEAYSTLFETARNKESVNQEEAVWGLRCVKPTGAVDLMMELVGDKSQRDNVRKYAAEGLSKKGKKAHRLLAGLLEDTVVREEAYLSLREAKDKSIFTTLFKHVRKAGEDYDLAKKAAWLIYKADEDWKPAALEDHVDYMLVTYALRIAKKLGAKAVPRLKHWLKSDSDKMKERAKSALSMYEGK